MITESQEILQGLEGLASRVHDFAEQQASDQRRYATSTWTLIKLYAEDLSAASAESDETVMLWRLGAVSDMIKGILDIGSVWMDADPAGWTEATVNSTRCAVTVAELGVNAVVGGGLMKLAEDAGERLGGAGHGAASGAVAQGSVTVLFNGRPAARTGDSESCHAGAIVQGSATVLINGRPAARVTDKTSCGAAIIEGSPDILIGGPVETTGPMQSEAPSWARWAAVAAGLLPALGGAARAIGPAIAEVQATGLLRAAQTGAKAVGRAMEARAGGAASTAVRRMPEEFQAEHAAAEAAGWKKPDGRTWYPPNDGAVGAPVRRELPAGFKLDRFGKESGSYVSAAGDPFGARALPGMPAAGPNNYVVLKPLLVDEAEIAPWFGQPGGGTQFKLVNPSDPGAPFSVEDALQQTQTLGRSP